MPTRAYRKFLMALAESAGGASGHLVDVAEVAERMGLPPSDVEFSVLLYEVMGYVQRAEGRIGSREVFLTEAGAEYARGLFVE